MDWYWIATLVFAGWIIRSLLSLIRGLIDYLDRLHRIIEELKDALTPGGASRIEFYANIAGKKRKVKTMFLKVTQSLPLTIEIKDAKGNPAKVDGAPEWAVTDEALATLEVSPDGFTATVTPMGPLGSVKVQVTADADLGEGVKSILGELDIDFLAGDATTIALSAGNPTDI
jgi:hypothetical protein